MAARPRPHAVDRLARWTRSESASLGVAAVAVGLLAAGGVWLFKQWIDVVAGLTDRVRTFADATAWGLAALCPAVGGLVVGFLRRAFIGEERHHGVAGIMEAVALAGGRLRWKRAPMKAFAAGLSIGAGASVGPEDPSVQVGASAGSMLGQAFHVSDDRVRALVAAGAAAGVAAAFDAPIAGVFFAVEIVLGELAGSALGAVLLAAVCSAALTHVLVGDHPAFQVPPFALSSVAELPSYVVLGAVAGVVAALYVTSIQGCKELAERARLPAVARPAVAGLVVGLAGLVLPQVLGVGYPTVEAVLQGAGPALSVVAALVLVKALATALCIGAGFPGGVFAPGLFVGAMLGAALGGVAHGAFPGVVPARPAFALVGMGAVLAGATHAPLTAILLLFELTRDYQIMVPAMLAATTSLAVARRLQRDSVYTLSLARKGVRLERGRDVEVLASLTVAEAMQTATPTVPEAAPAADALAAVERTRHLGLAVVDTTGALVGVVAAQDLDQASREGRLEGRTVGDVCTHDVVTAFPDETLADALRRMSTRDVGRLPVVERDAPRHLVGMLRRSDVVRAYDVALRRREAARHRAQQVRLGAMTGATVVELEVARGAACDGRRVADVVWPRDCVLASVRRGARLSVPRGDTTLRAGDAVVVVVETDASREACRALCETPRPVPPAGG